MKKNLYIYWVILLPLTLLLLDKIFALESVRDYTIPWKKIEIMFYESKEDLLSVYENNLNQHKENNLKRAIILGTSRSGEFSIHDLEKVLPEYAVYNFSAPLAGPAFHFYWLEKILQSDPELDLVILEVDPVLFSKTSLTYTLNYSLDKEFVFTHSHFFPVRLPDPWVESNMHGFSWDEVETWVNKHMFYSYRFPPDPSAIRDNGRETFAIVEGKPVSVSGKDYKTMFKRTIIEANRKEYGAIANQIFHEGDENFLKKDAKNMANIHLGDNFQPSKSQVSFFKKILEYTSKNNIRLVLYWPLVAKPFREELEKRNLVEDYQKKILSDMNYYKTKNPDWEVKFWDPHDSKDIKCRAFVDSVHLSGACYSELFSSFGRVFRNSFPDR